MQCVLSQMRFAYDKCDDLELYDGNDAFPNSAMKTTQNRAARGTRKIDNYTHLQINFAAIYGRKSLSNVLNCL